MIQPDSDLCTSKKHCALCESQSKNTLKEDFLPKEPSILVKTFEEAYKDMCKRPKDGGRWMVGSRYS